MHIFIDETGSFSGVGEFPSISIVGALIVPDSRLVSLEGEYAKIRKELPQDKGEVKGRLLNEQQIASVVPLLFNHSALFESVAIDLGIHTQQGLDDFQARQAEKITENLTDEHKDSLKKQTWEFRKRFEAFSTPLMVQTILTFEIVPCLLEYGTMYYSTRRPKELAHFHWVVDAKGNMGSPTEWEDWWSRFILPALQSRAFKKPIKRLSIGDYSHMKRFECELTPFVKKMADVKEGDPTPHDLGMIVRESFRFSKESEPGLELVDIITNATRRALVGNLQIDGWGQIPSLMIHRKGPHYINAVSLGRAPVQNRRYPYTRVLRAYGRGGRTMLPANLRSKKR
jgi:hypothetical protein